MRGAPNSPSFNAMHPMHWIPTTSLRLLDVGCNVGELLQGCAENLPLAHLAGVDVNPQAVDAARHRVPLADIRLVSGSLLPFPNASFDFVTCIEMLEHVPLSGRAQTLAEISRVLAPGGTLVLRCPHHGWFSWLDPANLRHRFPNLYRAAVRRGLRDAAYPRGADDIVWHHHFTEQEFRSLLPPALKVECVRFGGLFIFPFSDILRWPFYRARRYEHPIVRGLAWLAELDYGIDYGRSSYGILMVTRKIAHE